MIFVYVRLLNKIISKFHFFFLLLKTLLILSEKKMEIDTLYLLPGYSHLFIDRKMSSLIGCQFTFCLVTTIFISCYLFSKFVQRKEMSWRRALTMMGPLKERIGELDAQREILTMCLDNTEDLCDVYYTFLRCVMDKKKRIQKSGNENDSDEVKSNAEEDLTKTGSGTEEQEESKAETGADESQNSRAPRVHNEESNSTFVSMDETEIAAAGDLFGVSEKVILNE